MTPTPSFSSLHSLYSPRVRGAIAGILRYRPNEVEDAAQETWLRVWRALPTFEARASVWTWIYRIAVNCALAVLRKERRSGVVLESLDVVIEGEEEKKVVPRQLTVRDRRLELTPELLALQEAASTLSPPLRAAYERHFVRGETYQEIAGRRPVVTARNAGFRVMHKLRDELKGVGR